MGHSSCWGQILLLLGYDLQLPWARAPKGVDSADLALALAWPSSQEEKQEEEGEVGGSALPDGYCVVGSSPLHSSPMAYDVGV